MATEPVRILLVDDNDDDIVLTREAFKEVKMINSIEVAMDGMEALAFLRKEGSYRQVTTPGLVLLDINMPRKNGFEVLDEMKSDPKLQAIPVVMLTTSDRDEDIVRSYRKGACSYIRKPIEFSSLVEVVRQFSLYWTLVSEVPASPT